jgi:hypothetical protein
MRATDRREMGHSRVIQYWIIKCALAVHERAYGRPAQNISLDIALKLAVEGRDPQEQVAWKGPRRVMLHEDRLTTLQLSRNARPGDAPRSRQ